MPKKSSRKRKRNAFDLLSKPIRELIAKRGFDKPTEPQEKAIPLILEGKNVLLIAPTGTGKTEAAVLPVLDMLLRSGEKPGIRVLYITPLRALNRDLLERLSWWCQHLGIDLAVRHGDTEPRERARQSKYPPKFLITTPETLQAILAGFVLRKHLRSVDWVIVDEVHELATDKRGSQLSLALERLRWLREKVTDKDFQVIGLSATVGSPDRVAKFLVGTDRPVEIVEVPVARHMKLTVELPEPKREDYKLAEMLYTHPEVAARLRFIRKLIEGHTSVLLFTNTRAIAEVLGSRFKVWDQDFPVSVHHGSIAKPARIAAERGLKNGELKGLVCTSSLELGIDIGRVDLCIQYGSPRQVTRLVQRIGRSGHRIGRTAKGVIVAVDHEDALEAAIIARRALKEQLEPAIIPHKPYDPLIHQIVGFMMSRRRCTFDELLRIFRRAYPYRDLTDAELSQIIRYMHERYPRLVWADFEDRVVLKPRNSRGMYHYFFENLSMIPDEKQYLVVDVKSDTPVGILDECFVAEYGKPGEKFICRGSPWRIKFVSGDRIYVEPVDDPTGAIPSWIGEEIPVPYEVAMEVGKVRREVERMVKQGKKEEEIARWFSRKYPVSEETSSKILSEIIEQAEKGIPCPSDRLVTVEEYEEFIVIHCHFGTNANRALANILGYLLSNELGYPIRVQHDPYRVLLRTYGDVSAERVASLLKQVAKSDVERILRKSIAGTGIFKRRLVHVARKCGALAKHVEFDRVSLDRLAKTLKGTPIYEQAMRDVFEQDVDLEHLREAMALIRRGKIKVVVVKESPTPIARIGLKKISMKTDIIPPEKMKQIIIASARARLLEEALTFVCVDCWKYVKTMRVKQLPRWPKCPLCGSKRVGAIKEDEETVLSAVEKILSKKATSRKERRLLEWLEDSASLMEAYGKLAAIALAGHRLRMRDVEEVLEFADEDNIYERVVEAERRALKRRFW